MTWHLRHVFLDMGGLTEREAEHLQQEQQAFSIFSIVSYYTPCIYLAPTHTELAARGACPWQWLTVTRARTRRHTSRRVRRADKPRRRRQPRGMPSVCVTRVTLTLRSNCPLSTSTRVSSPRTDAASTFVSTAFALCGGDISWRRAVSIWGIAEPDFNASSSAAAAFARSSSSST